MNFQGTRPNAKKSQDNNNDFHIIQELRKETSKKKSTQLPAMDFPHVEERPTNEFDTERMFADAYPWLFPGRFGDIPFLDKQTQRKNAVPWTRKLMQWKDGRFMRDPLFTFHMPNFLQRHQNSANGLYFIKNYIDDDSITVEDIQNQIKQGDLSFINKLVNFTSQKVIGSDAWWRTRKQELDTWIAYHLGQGNGAPTLFLTFSCAEFWWKDLLKIICER